MQRKIIMKCRDWVANPSTLLDGRPMREKEDEQKKPMEQTVLQKWSEVKWIEHEKGEECEKKFWSQVEVDGRRRGASCCKLKSGEEGADVIIWDMGQSPWNMGHSVKFGEDALYLCSGIQLCSWLPLQFFAGGG